MVGWTWGIIKLIFARKEGAALSGSPWQVYFVPSTYIDQKHPVLEGGRLRSDRFLMRENVGFADLRRQGAPMWRGGVLKEARPSKTCPMLLKCPWE